MIFPTYGSVFACILLSTAFMFIVCSLGNRVNFILKNSANLLISFMLMVMLRMFFPCNFIFTKNIYSEHVLKAICNVLMIHIWKNYRISDIIIAIWAFVTMIYIYLILYIHRLNSIDFYQY